MIINHGWSERQLSNEEIIEALETEKKKSFLSFAYGVWVTAYARSNLLKNVILQDEHVVYCDTDSMKLTKGYDISKIEKYNKFVENKIQYVSETLGIDINKFAPTDIDGKKHMLGVFDIDGHYEEFITQGAKKYAYTKWINKDKIKEDTNVLKIKEDKALILEIVVAGVPKQGAKALKSLDDFRDNFIFKYEDTNKNLLVYIDEQLPQTITDYQGNKTIVYDISGCCIVPNTYTLNKAIEYANLISDNSSHRSIYIE